ncbi:hypothetical protein [Clostridium peptidivorans]|uniref:hypothetical protein n=1 Tax=Clostridium peptidivorans TaxID=100174 RepID=UPI0015C89293|nr:hypothetical protein [Clostridium peptidivorans]
MKVISMNEDSFLKVHLKKIYFISITVLTLVLCLISKSESLIFFLLLVIDGIISFSNPNYTTKIYEKPLYIKGVLLGIFLSFIIENKDAFLSYFI